MLPVETVKYLKELVDAANPAARIVGVEQEPSHVYLVQGPDGEFKRVTAQSQPERACAESLSTLVNWLGDDSPEIWYSRRAVIGGLEPGDDQHDRIKFELHVSPQLEMLCELERKRAGESLDQTALIRLLRTSLADCWSGDLLNMVRRVRIDKAKAVEAEQVKGRVSLSRKDLAEMSGAADLPEEIMLDVPVFANGTIHARATVRVALDLNPETERFVLTVIPGQTEKAFTTGETWLESTLQELIGDKGILLYHGTP